MTVGLLEPDPAYMLFSCINCVLDCSVGVQGFPDIHRDSVWSSGVYILQTFKFAYTKKNYYSIVVQLYLPSSAHAATACILTSRTWSEHATCSAHIWQCFVYFLHGVVFSYTNGNWLKHPRIQLWHGGHPPLKTSWRRRNGELTNSFLEKYSVVSYGVPQLYKAGIWFTQ